MDNADTIRRFHELLSDGDIDGFGAMLAEDFVEHEETPGLAPTKEGVVEFLRSIRSGFPDLRMDPEDVLADGDKAIVRVTMTGTHEGEFMGMPATGKRVSVPLIDIIRFEDGLARSGRSVVTASLSAGALAGTPSKTTSSAKKQVNAYSPAKVPVSIGKVKRGSRSRAVTRWSRAM